MTTTTHHPTPTRETFALLSAASTGDVAGVRAALADGASPSDGDQLNNTPLHVGGRYPEVVRVLLEAGAALDAVDNSGETPLHRAAAEGPWACVEAMREAGGDWFQVRVGTRTCPAENNPPFLAGTPLGLMLTGGQMEATLRTCGMSPDVLKNQQDLIEGRLDVLDGWLRAHPDAEGVGTEDLYRAMTHGGEATHREPCASARVVNVLARHGHPPQPWPFLLDVAARSRPLLESLLQAGMDVKGDDALIRLAEHGRVVRHLRPMAERLRAAGARWSEEALKALHRQWDPKPTGTIHGAAELLAWAEADARAQMLDDTVPGANDVPEAPTFSGGTRLRL